MSEFKVGDFIVWKNSWTSNDLVMIVGGRALSVSMELDLVNSFSEHLRHATNEEIAAGRRID